MVTAFSSLDLTSSTTTTTTSQPFRFFDLPAELRNAIYAELLTYNGIRPTITSSPRKTPSTTMTGTATLNALTRRPTLTNVLTRNDDQHFHHQSVQHTPSQRPQDFLAVLLTSRAFYAEAKDVFWRKNRFSVADGEERECFEGWLEKRGLRGIVRKVESALPVEEPDWVAQYRGLRESGRLGPVDED
ncbi:MAG: hypothetical protein Q9212_006126 [Teloschistes hypoglaucus]